MITSMIQVIKEIAKVPLVISLELKTRKKKKVDWKYSCLILFSSFVLGWYYRIVLYQEVELIMSSGERLTMAFSYLTFPPSLTHSLFFSLLDDCDDACEILLLLYATSKSSWMQLPSSLFKCFLFHTSQ